MDHRTENWPWRDHLGKPIVEGDLIVYPQRRGSSLWMESAIVVSLEKAKQVWGVHEVPVLKARKPQPGGKITKIERLDRVIVIR